MTWRDWTTTPFEVSYAQALGAGLTMIALLWIAGTLALLYLDAKTAIGTYLGIIESKKRQLAEAHEELHLCRRAHGRRYNPQAHPPE